MWPAAFGLLKAANRLLHSIPANKTTTIPATALRIFSSSMMIETSIFCPANGRFLEILFKISNGLVTSVAVTLTSFYRAAICKKNTVAFAALRSVAGWY